MRAVIDSSPIRALVLAAALIVAGCGNDQAESTTSTASVTDTTTTTTSSPASTLAATTTRPEPTTTEPAVAPDDLLVIGDWGSGTLPEGAVAGAMSRYAEDNDVEAIVTTGDNFYTDDTEFLMQPFGWAVDADVPFWITWGDHDIETDQRVEAVNEIFDHPPRWELYEWGAVDVIVLDSTQATSSEQGEFLSDALESSGDPTIVVFHHPPFSCGGDGGTETVREQWLGQFDEDVFLVLSGHEHNYQRFEEPIRTYVITGGGGAGLTELPTCPGDGPEMVAGESVHHFLVLEQGDDISVTALDVNSEVVDQFILGLP